MQKTIKTKNDFNAHFPNYKILPKILTKKNLSSTYTSCKFLSLPRLIKLFILLREKKSVVEKNQLKNGKLSEKKEKR